jgi:hypothetical protein
VRAAAAEGDVHFSFASLYHDSEGSYWKQSILKFATEKLSLGAGMEGRPFTRDTALAVLSVRCLLEFNGPTAGANLIPLRLVEDRMRIAYTFPESRNYVRSGYSSEPVLAEAAGRIMQDHEDAILQHLEEAMNDGEILGTTDFDGGLEGRLLLAFAYSDALREVSAGLHKPRIHTPVPLLVLLRNLFSEDIYAELCRMHGGRFEEDFADAYVHFSHFAPSGDESELTPSMAAAALFRGLACNFESKTAAIDILVPVIFGKDTKFSAENLSIFGWKSRTRGYWAEAVASTFARYQRLHEGLSENGFKKPALYIHADLSTETPVLDSVEPLGSSSTRPSSYVACLRGRGPEAYAALGRLRRQTAFGAIATNAAAYDLVTRKMSGLGQWFRSWNRNG